jgi:hypothetical protein
MDHKKNKILFRTVLLFGCFWFSDSWINNLLLCRIPISLLSCLYDNYSILDFGIVCLHFKLLVQNFLDVLATKSCRSELITFTLSIYLSVRLSACQPACLSVCPSFYMYM